MMHAKRLGVIALLMGSSLARVATASTSYNLVSSHTLKCMDALGAGVVAESTCALKPTQNWVLQPNATRQYQIINQSSGLCLDVMGSSTAEGAPIQMSTCTAGPSQLWTVQDRGNDFKQMRNVNSGFCLDETGGNTFRVSVPTVIQQKACGAQATSTQLWQQAALLPALPIRSRVMSDFLGINLVFPYFKLPEYQSQIRKLQGLGIKWVRIALDWAYLEPVAGAYNLAEVDPFMSAVQNAGLIPTVYVVGTPFWESGGPQKVDTVPPRRPADFVHVMVELARRYPFVHSWGVWNEENLTNTWLPQEDPAGYTALLKDVSIQFRTLFSEADLAIGGMGYFGEMPTRGGNMLHAIGALGAYGLADVADYHPYVNYPEGDLPSLPNFLPQASAMNQYLRSQGVKNIWASEFGWSTYSGPQEVQPLINEDTQADYDVKQIVEMMALDFDRVFLFDLADLDGKIPNNRDAHYGLLGSDSMSVKPSYSALQRLMALSGRRLDPLPSLLPVAPSAGLSFYSWVRDDGTKIVFFWGQQPGNLVLDGIESAVLHQLVTGSQQNLQGVGNRLTVPIATTIQALEIPTSKPNANEGCSGCVH